VLRLKNAFRPRQITIRQSASDPKTLAFVGTGVAIIIPIAPGYQGYAYWIFRGKSEPSSSYGPTP
jgi:cytochrome d ubiquinol oxidase subunit II